MEEYLHSLRVEKHYSQNTTAAYRNDLTQFGDFLKRRIGEWNPSAVTPEIMRAYVEFLKANRYVPATIARKAASIRSFFRYLAERGIIASDPTVELDVPRVKKQTPRVLDRDSMERLLAAPGNGNQPRALRDLALLQLLYATGLRVTEAVSLTLADVDREARVVVCRGDDNRQRKIPLGPAYTALAVYLERGRPALRKEPDTPALFLNHRGRGLTRQGLWLIIKEYAKKAGVGEDVTPYTLRHSFARHLLSGGANVQEVQSLLGHANLATTQAYARLPPARTGGPCRALPEESEPAEKTT